MAAFPIRPTAFTGAVDVLSFGFFGKVRLDLNEGLTADLEASPIELGGVLKLLGDGKGVTIKVDAEGNPIRNNLIRDIKKLQAILKDAKDQTLVKAGGRPLGSRP